MTFTPNRDWMNSGYATPAGKRMSWVFVVLGFLLMGLGVWLGIQRHRFLSHAAHAQGIIVAMDEHSGSHANSIYNPVFTFKDATGREWRHESTSGSSSPTYQVGQTVDVYYSPSHPATAELNGFFALWSNSLLVGGIGLFMFLAGLLLVRTQSFQAYQASRARPDAGT